MKPLITKFKFSLKKSDNEDYKKNFYKNNPNIHLRDCTLSQYYTKIYFLYKLLFSKL